MSISYIVTGQTDTSFTTMWQVLVITHLLEAAVHLMYDDVILFNQKSVPKVKPDRDLSVVYTALASINNMK